MKASLLPWTICLLAVLLPNASIGQTPAVISIDGSTAIDPLIEDVAQRFRLENPATELRVERSTSSQGLARLLEGTVDVAISSREITRDEDAAFARRGSSYLEVPIALDGVALVTPAANEWLQVLTFDDLDRLWCGEEVETWDQVSPEGPPAPIVREAPAKDSGAVTFLAQVVCDGTLGPAVRYNESHPATLARVAGEPNAIGLLGSRYLQGNSEVRAIAIDESFGPVLPSPASLEDATYPLSRPVWLYLSKKAARRPEVSEFVLYLIDHVGSLAADHGLATLGAPLLGGARRRFEDRTTGSVMLAGGLSEIVQSYFYFGTTSVTATGASMDTFQIPSPVIVIDAERIDELLPDNPTDLLRGEPGVDVNGVGPNQARPIIRGQRGLRILFLENGLRLNNARRQTDFGEITGLVDVGNVETMEVVRGPASVLYGSDAIGGVLNLITKAPSTSGSRFGLSLRLRTSSVDDQDKGSLSLFGHGDRFSYRLGYSRRSAEDYEAGSGRFGDIELEGKTPVLDTGLDDDSANLHLAYRVNDRHAVSFRVNRYRADETGYGLIEPSLLEPDPASRVEILYPFQDFDRYTFAYDASGLEATFADSVEFQVYRQSNARELANDIFIDFGPIFGPGPSSDLRLFTLNYSDVDTVGFRAELTKILGNDSFLIYGAEYFEDDSFNTDHSTTTTTLRAYFPVCSDFVLAPPVFECEFVDTDDTIKTPNATNRGYGAFVEETWTATSKLTATLGLRYAKAETKAEATPGWDTTGLEFADDAVVGALHLTYGVTPNLNLVGSYATAFRAPNIIEWLFRGVTPEGSGFQILNADLESEKSENVDFGVKFRRANAYFEATYFNTEIKDAIVQRTLTEEEILQLPPEIQAEIEETGLDVVVQQRNADRLTIEGLEVTGGYRFGNGFSLGANFTHLTGRSATGNPKADPTSDTFSQKINARVRYDQPKGRFWVEYSLRHNGEEDVRLDPAEAPGPLGEVLPAFTIHRLAGGATVFERDRQKHTLGVVVDNLSDQLYSEFSNALFFRPQPGRNVILTYALHLE